MATKDKRPTQKLSRYNFCTNESPHLRERPDGTWVRYAEVQSELTQLRGNLSLAEDGLASAAQQIIDLENSGQAMQAEIERLQPFEKAALYTQGGGDLAGIQQARLTWALACQCTCDACETLNNAIQKAVGGSPEPRACTCPVPSTKPNDSHLAGCPTLKSGVCCHTCDAAEHDKTGKPWDLLNQMIVCPDCGNKRCPKASDHTLACTNSNESGQTGSVYR